MAHWLDTREVMEAVGLGHLLKVGSARCPISGRFVGNQEPSDDEVVEKLCEPSYDPNAEYEAAQAEPEYVDDVFDPIWDYNFTDDEDSEGTLNEGQHSYHFDEDNNQYPHDFNGDDYPDNDEEDYAEWLLLEEPLPDNEETVTAEFEVISPVRSKFRWVADSHGKHGRKPVSRRQQICRGYKQKEFDSRISS